MFSEKFISYVNIIFAPSEYFLKIQKQPYWISPFIIITLLTVVVGYLLLPFKQEVVFSTLSAQIGEVRALETLTNANRFALLGLLLTPIPLLLKWVIIALMLYYAAILFNAQNVNLKMVFSIVVHAELVLLFMGIINIFILEVKGLGAVKSYTDLQTIVGLDYLLTNKLAAPYLFTVLSNFNIFTVWYIVILTLGLSIASQLEKWKCLVIVSLLWVFGIGFQVAIVFLSTTLQKMLGK